MCSGLLGTLVTSVIVRQGSDNAVLPHVLQAMIIAVAVQIPLVIVLFSVQAVNVAYILYGAVIFCGALLSALMPIPLLVGTPNRMRGRLIALFLLTVNLIANSIGPAAV